MAVLYNMNPFPALKIIYRDETDGFPEEDFQRNSEQRGVTLPFILQKFLKEYGYMSVNRQSSGVRYLHPNLVTKWNFNREDGGVLRLLTVGRVGNYQIAIRDEPSNDPTTFLLQMGKEQATRLMPSDDTISELIKVMICGVLFGKKGAVLTDDPEKAVELLRENNFDLMKIRNNPELRREYSLNFSEEMRTFAVAEFVEGELNRFFFVSDESFVN